MNILEGRKILMMIAGVQTKCPQAKHVREVVVGGFRVNEENGIVLGPQFVAESNLHSWDGEIFQYAREHRFRLLFRYFSIPLRRRGEVLSMFLALEVAWEKRKHLHDRIYFISQKLTCIQICRRLGIPHVIDRFPIRDRKRLTKQLLIFADLWAHRECTTEKIHGRTIVDKLRIAPSQND